MFSKFKYERIPLSLIKLDLRNPRIVTQQLLQSEDEIVRYFYEHEGLAAFLKKIGSEGRNQGAERPYVVRSGKEYVVIEGNTRIATYKLITGQLTPPDEFANTVPHLPTAVKEDMLSVDCTIAPSRDALLPIMASAHFGVGDKNKWGYLGSRKAVYDERKSGRSIAQLASAFDRKQGQIRDLILEYQLYLEALKLPWTEAEKQELLSPAVEFNPPVRFLQSKGHLSAVGVNFDRINLTVTFESEEARNRFKHLVKKLVVNPERGLGATATYKEVFADYTPTTPASDENGNADGKTGKQNNSQQEAQGASSGTTGSNSAAEGDDTPPDAGGNVKGTEKGKKLSKGALFNYTVNSNNLLHTKLMKEAGSLNTINYPAAGTALLRSILEAILKGIIEDQGANPAKSLLSLDTALDICLGNKVSLGADDRKTLKEFKKSHIDYVNLGTHATIIPNHTRLIAARDCIDQFVMRNI